MFAYGSQSSSIFQHGAQETAHSQQNHKTGLPTTSKKNIDQGSQVNVTLNGLK